MLFMQIFRYALAHYFMHVCNQPLFVLTSLLWKYSISVCLTMHFLVELVLTLPTKPPVIGRYYTDWSHVKMLQT